MSLVFHAQPLTRAIEADLVAGFRATFDAMDADGDGFVSDAEYRARAKANLDPPR